MKFYLVLLLSLLVLSHVVLADDLTPDAGVGVGAGISSDAGVEFDAGIEADAGVSVSPPAPSVFIDKLRPGQLQLTVTNIEIFNQMVRDARLGVVAVGGKLVYDPEFVDLGRKNRDLVMCMLMPSTKKTLSADDFVDGGVPGEVPMPIVHAVELPYTGAYELRILFKTGHLIGCFNGRKHPNVTDVQLKDALQGIFRVEIAQ